MKTTIQSKIAAALPADIERGDLQYPKFDWTPRNAKLLKNIVVGQFEIWRTDRFGWCIPTLLIKNVSRNSRATFDQVRRTYAVAISDGGTVRLGLGPHVKEHFTVYVTKASVGRLQKFLDMQKQGAGRANEIRDVISTRRMRSASRGSGYGWAF